MSFSTKRLDSQLMAFESPLISDRVRAKLDAAQVARLGTLDSNQEPHLVPICYAFDGSVFYTAIDRTIFTGSLEQISEDVRGCAKIGASEVFFDPTFAAEGQSLDYWMSLLDQLIGTMGVS